jgi:putative hydrolase of the HAD superfamily
LSYKAIAFDVGDTLIVRRRDVAGAVCEVLARHGYEIWGDAVEALIPEMNRYAGTLITNVAMHADQRALTEANHEKYRFLLRRLGVASGGEAPGGGALPEDPVDLMAREIQSVYDVADAWAPIEGAAEMLAELKGSGFKLAVISNWTDNMESILEGLGLAGYFDTIVVSAACGLYKPHPAIFRLAAERLGAEPSECLHVGDSIVYDVGGSLAAGFGAVLYRPDATDEPEGATAPNEPEEATAPNEPEGAEAPDEPHSPIRPFRIISTHAELAGIARDMVQ